MNRAILVVVMLVSAIHLNGQTTLNQVDPTNAKGIMAYGTFGGLREDINLATGNLHLELPILSIPGRAGHSLDISLQYDSKIWQLDDVGNPTDGDAYVWGNGTGWKIAVPELSSAWAQIQPITHPNFWCNTAIVFTGLDGGNHSFLPVGSSLEVNGGRLGCQSYLSSTNTWSNSPSFNTPQIDSMDGSFLHLDSSNPADLVVSDKSGLHYHFYGLPAFGDQGGGKQVDRIEDSNGNYWNFTYTNNGSTVTITDTANRSYTLPRIAAPGVPAQSTLSYLDANGQPQVVTFTSTTVYVAPGFSQPVGGSTQPPHNVSYFLGSVSFPYGRTYTFSYNNFGELTKITYPTGGYTRYDYGAFTATHYYYQSNSSPTLLDFREVVARYVCQNSSGVCTPDQEEKTTYQPTIDSSQISNQFMEVTDPPAIGTRTKYQFSLRPTSGGAKAIAQFVPRELTRWIYSPTGALLRTIQTDYNNLTAIGTTMYSSLPIRQTTTLNDVSPNLVSKVEWDYNPAVGNVDDVTTKREYDWGSGAPGPLRRRTEWTWLKVNPINSRDYTQPSLRILDRKASEAIYDGDGNPFSQTQYEYDNFTAGIAGSSAVQHDPAFGTSYTARGNVTAISRWRNTDGAWLQTRNQYDDAGNVVSTTDAGGHTTFYGYADSWGNAACANGTSAAYLTRITNAAGHVTQLSRNSCTGSIASITDPNLKTTSYAYDALGRLLTINYPDGGQLSNVYSDPLTVTTTRTAAPNPNIVSSLIVDGLGRKYQTRLADPEGDDFTETTYDAMERVSAVTNPHRLGAAPTDGTTQFSYDAFGRTGTITKQDGSTVLTAYSGNCATTSDEIGRQRKSCTDALGRLTGVWEDPSGRNYETDYTYDPLDNLLTVVQKGDNTAPRTRSFFYNSLSQLTQAMNPESGTIQYGYDADGNLISKTDARGIVLTYSYDSLHRLTDTFGPSLHDAYIYDAAPAGFTAENPIGRLVEVSNYVNASHSMSYDAMGRVKYQTSCRPSSCTQTSYPITASYDQAGSLTSLTYPSGRKLTFANDAAGHFSKAVFDSFGGLAINYTYLNVSAHHPTGAANISLLGSGVTESDLFNKRLQPSQFTLSGLQTWADHAYNWVDAISGRNNGNVWGVSDQLNPNRTQTFGYDTLNRLLSASESGASGWGQQYAYDPWGNLYQMVPTKGSPPQFYAAPPGSSNHFSASDGYQYDAAGNMTADGIHTYQYDGESRLSSVDTTGATYVYEGDGNRARKDTASNGSTEYIYFGGEVIAEYNPAKADWTDYIYANGERIAKAEGLDRGVRIYGTRCSACGTQYALYNIANAGGLMNYVIQSGDKLVFTQYQRAGSKGGMRIDFSDGTKTTWDAKDQDGYWINDDQLQSTTHARRIDLSAYAGKAISNIAFKQETDTAAGSFAIIFEQVVLVSLDGTVHPIYTGQTSSPVASITGTSGVTGRGSQIDTNRNKGKFPDSTTTYYHSDHLGSARLTSGGFGWPLWQATYLPFGYEYNPQMSSDHYKFTGKERDAESGLDYFGARYYASNMGRWMSPDEFAGGPVDVLGEGPMPPGPLPYADLANPQSLNKYTYTYDDPIRYSDPDGHCVEDLCMVEGAVAGIVMTIQYLSTPQGQQTVRDGVQAAEEIVGAGINYLKQVKPFDVGTYGDLKGQSVPGDGIDIHHVPQAGQASQVVPGYDPKTAPAIALPKDQHKDIPADRGEAKRSPRDQVAKDVKDLRKHTDAPRGQVQKLIDKIKRTYPDSMKKPGHKPYRK